MIVKIFITKYALSGIGVISHDAVIDDEGWATVTCRGEVSFFLPRKDYALSKMEAREKFIKMKESKIKSLEKKLKSIRRLEPRGIE